MQTIAFYSPKGGVGKTASAVNIAYLAALAGNKTVLWDLDPQGASSWYLGKADAGGHHAKRVKQLIKGDLPVGKLLTETDYPNLDLIEADTSCRDLDVLLEDTAKSKKKLGKLIEPLSEDKNLVVIDCPPTFSVTAKNVFQAVDALFVPLIPTHLSLNAFHELLNVLDNKKYQSLKVYPFFTMVDRRRKLHKDVINEPPTFLKRLMKAKIPYSTHIEQMGDHRAPVNRFADKSLGGLAYRVMWFELSRKVKYIKRGSVTT